MVKFRKKVKDPWSIRREDFPKKGTIEDQIKFVLSYAILAPSTHNSQPWLFKIQAGFCKIYYDKNLKLPEADPLGRDLYISIGCMLENLVTVADYFGIFGDMKLYFKDDYIGEIFFKTYGDQNLGVENLVDAIPKRINARGLFEPGILPYELKTRLAALNNNELIRTSFITEKEKIEELAGLTAEGLRYAYAKKSFRREMFKWMHNSLTRKRDGLPGYSLRMPFVISFIMPTLVKFLNVSPILAKLNRKSVASAPMICILSSKESSPKTWLEIGRLAQRMMLQLVSDGMRTSIFVASIEMGDFHNRVREISGADGDPQFLFCAGHMKKVQKHSPRKSLEKILT